MLATGFEALLVKLIEQDSCSFPDGVTKTKKLKSALAGITKHLQQQALQPKPHPPVKSSRLLRRILSAWNTEQYNLLPALFKELETHKKVLLPPQSLANEEELQIFLRPLFFRLSFMVKNVSLLLTPATKEQPLTQEASVLYLLQEAQELAFASEQTFTEPELWIRACKKADEECLKT